MENAPRRIADLDHSALRPEGGYYPSPNWSDQTLYFLLVDRFSNGDEQTSDNPDGQTPLARQEDRGNAFVSDESAERWRDAGKRFVGGSLKGVRSKLGYLKRLGVTALWVSPVLKQRPSDDYAYHGYGTQDFLRVEPRFGTAEDLRDLVAEAHRQGMVVVLDIILNHAAEVFAYEQGGVWTGEEYPVKGWIDAKGQPSIPFVKADPNDRSAWPGPDDAVWPVELQDPVAFNRKGGIGDWDNDPEFREGDFFNYRDFKHGEGGLEDYKPAPALVALTEAYKHWIAYADLDGFRIDTVKHMDPGAVRFFSETIQEFGQSLGKDDFFLVGEITGGRGFALDTMQKTGLDAALGISGESCLLEGAVKGDVDPQQYFDLFGKSSEVPRGSDAWFSKHMVTILDDHDEVCNGEIKSRFAADEGADRLVLAASALNALTTGIPCIYYGSEQAFDGRGEGDDAERYIRESMFGGEFGAFGSRCVHFFDESSPTYKGLAEILKVRKDDLAIRRGRQFLRQVSGDGEHFAYPTKVGDAPMRSIVAWSRVLDDDETVIAINTDPENATTAWVTIDGDRHEAGNLLTCVLCPGEETEDAVTIEPRNGLAVKITLPPGGVAVYR